MVNRFSNPRDRSRTAATSKMERFVIIVNGLDVAAVLDPTLIPKFFFWNYFMTRTVSCRAMFGMIAHKKNFHIKCCHYRLRCQEHDLLLFDLALEVFTLLPSLEIPFSGMQRALQMYCESDSSYTFHSHNHS